MVFLLNYFIFLIIPIDCYILPQVYREFHPIGIYNNIDKNKPFLFNIGKLPLLLWFDNNNPITIINSCKHLGNDLSNGYIKDKCFLCPFHKTVYNNSDNFGSTVIKDGLVWWNYKSFYKNPPKIPMNDKNENNYDTINFKMNININFINFIINFIYINNNNINIKLLSKNKKLFITVNDNYNKIRFYYKYPYSIIISYNFNHKIKSTFMINLLPIATDKTRLYISIKYKKGFINYINNWFNAMIIKYYLFKFKNKYENSNNNNDIKFNYMLSFKNKKNNDDYIYEVFNFYKDYMDLFYETTIHNFLINKNYY